MLLGIPRSHANHMTAPPLTHPSLCHDKSSSSHRYYKPTVYRIYGLALGHPSHRGDLSVEVSY